MKKVLTILIVLLFAIKGYSTHLVGGTLHYQSLGKDINSNNYKYNVVVTIYRDCIRGLAQFDNQIVLCAYNQSDNNLNTNFTIDLDSFVSVDPVENANCPLIAKNVCLEKATYTKVISLPASTSGYILKWERCCRNEQVNLPNRTTGNGGNLYGQSYLGYIPNTSINNSSPYFTEVPVPYMCLNDTTQMKNFAIDPDGDSLVYSLIKPNAGASPTAPRQVVCPSTFNLQKVVYTTGFSESQPFGSNGYAAINKSSGLTTYMSTIEGNFSVAVEVKEFRNNVLLSKSILDLQVLVIKCIPNAKPEFNNGFKNYFEVDAGDTLCFNFSGIDSDTRDSITMKVIGNLFTGANGFKGTKARFTEKTDSSKVNSQFCWETDCDQGRDQLYTFNIELKDNGCPPKTNTQNISIKVNPFVSKIVIIGDTAACEGEFSYTAVNGKPGSSYLWEITGGTIISGQGTRSIRVKWNLGTGKISVTETANSICLGIKKEKFVNVTPFISNVEIQGDSIACEGEFPYRAVNGKSGSKFIWTAQGGTIINGQGTNIIKVKWALGSGNLTVKEISKNGCSNDSTEKVVTVKIFISKVKIIGDSIACAGEFVYQAINGKLGSTFEWEIEGGTLVSGQGTNNIKIKWENGTGKIKVKEITSHGCINSGSEKLVTVKPYISNVNLIGDSIVCTGEFIYLAVNGEAGSTYTWEVDGGDLISGQSSEKAKIKWNLGGGKIRIKETTKEGCISSEKQKTVTVKEFISDLEIMGDSIVCNGEFKYYILNKKQGSSFTWEIEGGALINGQGTDSIEVDWLIGKGKIKVREINKEGCTSAEVEKEITVNEFISNLEIIGDAQICEGKIYTYTFIDGKEGSTFEWEIEGGEIISGQGTTTIKIKWSGKPIRITVKETNMDGCPGQTKELLVVNYNTKDDGYWWGNVITPNGDGKNDCFAIDGLAPECNKLDVKIVNRWGQIVFESTNINDCWDGTLKGSGKLASTGTYYYVLKLEIDGGETIDTHGTITIL